MKKVLLQAYVALRVRRRYGGPGKRRRPPTVQQQGPGPLFPTAPLSATRGTGGPATGRGAPPQES
ncbi:hypothetical protein BSZ07_35670 [Streptomyces sp. M1013]|nr:hypothetical protein BSZ07_35670 [Streptomyces sp. M1013]